MELIYGFLIFTFGFWLGMLFAGAIQRRLGRGNDKKMKDLIGLVEDPKDMVKHLQTYEEARNFSTSPEGQHFMRQMREYEEEVKRKAQEGDK